MLWRAHTLLFVGAAIPALAVFGALWLTFWLKHPCGHYFFFDPQDAYRDDPGSRAFPVSAPTATFEPLLKHYTGVMQLLVTVAAASIAFGGNSQPPGIAIAIAKLSLAWSVFYGVLFCAVLLWRYDEYGQNMKSYTLNWYSTIFALGFSSLFLFMSGYLVWGWGVSRIISHTR